MSENTSESASSPENDGSKVLQIRLAILVFALILLALIADFFTTLRIVDLGEIQQLDARDGKIIITYNRPVERQTYYSNTEGLHLIYKISDDRLTETYTIVKPTAYNKAFQLIRSDHDQLFKLFGLARPQKTIDISTGIEQVSIKGMIPAENTRPSPEVMNNQLVLQFNGEIIGRYQKDINIPVAEMEFVKLKPEANGYYRWVDESVLTFNFTETKPQFETEYEFEVFPEKFINKEYQTWAGKRTKIAVTTSINEVYVQDFSLKNEITWQQPLRIEFSGNMVGALDVLKFKDQDELPIDITPAPGGQWVWINARTLEFRPDNVTGWPTRQTVNVNIRPEINRQADRKWRKGNETEQYSFYVKPREQSITSYNLRGESVALEDDLVVRFSRDMVEADALRKKITNQHIADNIPLIFEPHIAGEFYWVRPDKVKFRPNNLWSELTEYKITLNPAFNPDRRYEWTGTKEFSFKTVENLVRVEYFMVPELPPSPAKFFANKQAYKQYDASLPENRLWILFDKDVGRFIKRDANLTNLVKIQPAINGKFKWLSNSLMEFVPENNWNEKTDYTVTLSKELLYHPQQHFAEGQGSLKFKTQENLVYLEQLNERYNEKTNPYRLYPHNPLEFKFSKNMLTQQKVGKTYESSEVAAEYLPVALQPAHQYSFRWSDQRNLVIYPKEYWLPEQEYKITLNKKLLPQAQADYVRSNQFSLKTYKNTVTIEKFTPQGRVDRRVIVDVHFSRNIRPQNTAIGSADKIGLFTIKPKIAGDWTWLADNKIQFKPADALKASTQYTVTFDPNRIPDKQYSWHTMDDKDKTRFATAEYTFYTPALYVSQSRARFDFNKKDLLKQRFYLDIELSDQVSADDLRKHFSIWYEFKDDKGNYSNVPLIYTLEAKGQKAGKTIKSFSVVSDWIDRPADDRKILYKITKGLAPVTGNLKLDDDYENYFLQERPKYIHISNVNWQWIDRKYKAILSLNAPVEPEVLQKYLSVTHEKTAMPYEVSVHSTPYGQNFSYEVDAEFLAGIEYHFSLKQGMLAADGAFTSEDIDNTYTTPNLSSKLAFGLKGNILSRKDMQRIPVKFANLPQSYFQVSIDKVYANNVNAFLNHYFNNSDISQVAKRIHSQRHNIDEVTGEYVFNEERTAHIDLSELFRQNRHGIYRVSIGQNHWQQSDNRWIIATDIGLITRRFNNTILVWANSLNSKESLANVSIEVFDQWNQVIGRGKTDQTGFANVTIDKDSIAKHITAKLGDDFSFIDLARQRERFSGVSTEGIKSDQTYIRSFVYSDRGVYRPGDTVHLVAVTRGKDGVLPENFPVVFKLHNPTGKEAVSERFTLEEHGVYVYDYVIPAEAKTGKWKSSLYWKGNHIGNYTFQVEEFVPNKIKVELELLNKRVLAGDKLSFKVKGKNLFGPPASGRKVTGKIKLVPSYFQPKGYGNFRFGHDDNQFQRIEFDLSEAKLDDNGHYVYEYQIPDNIDSPIGINASYSATVIDDGGRGVTAYQSANVYMYGQYVGVRRLSNQLPEVDGQAGFEIVNVDADGDEIKRLQQQLEIKVYRNKYVTHYRKNERGYYRYVREKQRILVDELPDKRDAENKLYYKPRYGGEHILEVHDKVGQQTTRFNFYVRGSQDTSGTISDADKVQLRVLNNQVLVDKEIKLEVQAPFAGKVILIGEREKVFFHKVINVTQKKQIVTLPVSSQYLPNIYISAMAIKSVNQGNRFNPIYATGLININVRDEAHTPTVKLLAPKQISPNGELSIDLSVDDMNNKSMFFTIAAVDVGILDLTNFKLPVVDDYFNQKRQLEVEHAFMYPMVMPYEPDYKHIIEPSGGAPSRALIKKKRVNPDSQQRIKSVALWSGLKKFDANGRANVRFKVPDFNGRLRIMAVAYGDQRFASHQQEIIISDKLVLKPTLPRFVATEDKFIIPIKLFNTKTESGWVKVTLNSSDHFKLQGSNSKTVQIKANGEASVDFAMNVLYELGLSEIEIIAEGLGEKTRKLIKIPVRTPGTLITQGDSGEITESTPRSIKLPDHFIEGTQQYALKVSANPLAKFQGGLSYLLRYPHGCLEQTTSKAFPLIYYADMATSAGDMFTNERSPRYFVREAIKKIERMQLENGSFSYWEGTTLVNNWSFIYSSHFLVEAQKAGFKIDETVWNNMLHRLKTLANKQFNRTILHDRDYGVTHLLYALYVLALANENIVAQLNFINDNFIDDLRLHDIARLAAAYSISGNTDTARTILERIVSLSEYDNPYRDTGGSFSSSIRDMSIVLDAIVTVDPESNQIPLIIDKLAELARYGRWGSTQENAFAFLAIGKASAKSKSLKVKATIVLGDGRKVPFDKEVLLSTPELLKGEVRVEVSGKGEVNFIWEAVGIDKAPKSLQQDQGVQIRRRYLNTKGEPADLNNIRQGDLIVVELKMESNSGTLDNMVITDLLPTGLEIENARLSTSATIDWIRQGIRPDYVDIRDDRINIFLSIPPNSRTYYYTTRAVTIGSFAVPPVRAEAMYDPDVFSEANRGKMRIIAEQ